MKQAGVAEQGRIAVRVRNVTMDFGSGAPAVDRASFDLEAGRFLTILGPSGSGKTTLLRMIAGFQRPTSGQITVGGRAVDAMPPHRRSVGMVFQRLALFPHMTAAENVAFPPGLCLAPRIGELASLRRSAKTPSAMQHRFCGAASRSMRRRPSP